MCTLRRSGSSRINWLIYRVLAIVLALAVCSSIAASPAAADSPTHGMDIFTGYLEYTDGCTFTIYEKYTQNYTYTDFFDKNGTWTWTIAHITEVSTYTANGKTLISLPYKYEWKIVADSNGNLTHLYMMGVQLKVPLPDGSVFFSAGRLDWLNPTTPLKGTTKNLAGFCAALAP